MSDRVSNSVTVEGSPSSLEELDNLQRSTEKMKSTEISVTNKIAMEEENPLGSPTTQSYKDKLLNAFGESSSEEELWGETEEEFLEKKWYDEFHMNGQSEPKPFNSRPEIVWTDEELDQWSKPWHNTLIAKVLGKKVSFKHIETKINKDWSKDGAVKVTDMMNGFYLVRLQAQTDYNRALFEGLWKVANHYLIVQRWRPLFAWSATLTQKVAVWIRIPNLPLELCNDVFLKKIGNTIGTML